MVGRVRTGSSFGVCSDKLLEEFSLSSHSLEESCCKLLFGEKNSTKVKENRQMLKKYIYIYIMENENRLVFTVMIGF